MFDELDDIWFHWKNLFKKIVDTHASIKRRSLRNNYSPWIDLSIQKQIRVRNRLTSYFAGSLQMKTGMLIGHK